MQHSDHLATVMEAIATDSPVPLCVECREIVGTMTVAGTPVKLESFDE